MPDEQVADSSTAFDEAALEAIAEGDMDRYAEIQNIRDTADREGTALPEAPPPSRKSSEKTDPDSEPGKASQETKPRKTGEDRKVELKAEIDELLKQRAELKAEVSNKGEKKAAEPPPAETKTEVAKDPKLKAPVEPKLEDFANYAEYQAADRAYTRELVKYGARLEIEAARNEESAKAQNKALQDAVLKRIEEARAVEPDDFDQVAFSKDTPLTPAMDGFILDSEVGPRILYRLGLNGSAEGKRIAQLAPYKAVRALMAIEREITGADEAPAKAATPAKKHTAAPPPATDLGARRTEPADPIMAALGRGDTETYIRLSNLRDAKAKAG